MYKEYFTGPINSGATNFRLATKEEIEESKVAHKNGECDAGLCKGVFIDRSSYAYDIRYCAICENVIGMIWIK